MYKKVLGVAGLFALSLVAILVYTSGVEGEVFLVSKDGRAVPAVGAHVWLFKDAGPSSYTKLFQTVQEPLMQALAKRIDDRMAETSQANSDPIALEVISQRIQHDQDWFCRQIEFGLTKNAGQAVQEYTTDRNGKFRLRALPASYVIWVSGQAGSQKANWLKQVKLVWRAEVRVVDTVCEEKME